MKLFGLVGLSWAMVATWSVSLSLPPVAAAEELSVVSLQNPKKVVMLDVSLQDGGVFVGQILTANAAPVIGENVAIRQGEKVVAKATTDKIGRFEARGLSGGVYTVVAKQRMANYRVWAPGTAPPAAQPAALMVVGDVVRGQGVTGNVILNAANNPWVLTGAAATGIAGPVMMEDTDGPAS